MADAMLGWSNIVAWATLTASSEAPGRPATMLRTQHGSTLHAWQTPGGVTSATLLIDAGDPQAWRALGVFRTNLSPGALLRWRLGNAADMAAPVYDSGTLAGTVADGYGQGVHALPQDITARYALLNLDDTSNRDGFLSVPLAYAGPVLQPRVGLGYGTRHALDRDELVARSMAGQEYVTLRSQRRRWVVELPILDAETEFWPGVAELERVAADGSNVLVIPFPGGRQQPREAVFGRLTAAEDAAWGQKNEPWQRRWTGSVVERL